MMDMEEKVKAAIKEMKEALSFRDMEGSEYHNNLRSRVKRYTGVDIGGESKIHAEGTPEAEIEIMVANAEADVGIVQYQGVKDWHFSLAKRRLNKDASEDVERMVEITDRVHAQLVDKYSGREVSYKTVQDDAERLYRKEGLGKDALMHAFMLAATSTDLNIKKD